MTPPSSQPMVVIGVPIYNHAEKLPEALESLLLQRYRNVRFVLVDDASTDNTPEICRRYSELDQRVVYIRNEQRLGYVQNARKAFFAATAAHPHAKYFAWGSDHDVWHPAWLESLVRALEDHPSAVLAYSKGVRIDAHGRNISLPMECDLPLIEDTVRRYRRTILDMQAGNMVYGLYRVEVLQRTEVMPNQLMPDRLLLAQMILYGQFVQVPQILWYRRYSSRIASIQRQRTALWPEKPPLHSYLPPTITHTWYLFNRFARSEHDPHPMANSIAFPVAATYFVTGIYLRLVRSISRAVAPIVGFLKDTTSYLRFGFQVLTSSRLAELPEIIRAVFLAMTRFIKSRRRDPDERLGQFHG